MLSCLLILLSKWRCFLGRLNLIYECIPLLLLELLIMLIFKLVKLHFEVIDCLHLVYVAQIIVLEVELLALVVIRAASVICSVFFSLGLLLQ